MVLLHHATKIWPEVLGGFIAYCFHTLFHGVYRRIVLFAVRLAKGQR